MNRMLPVISEVVDIEDARLGDREQLRQKDRAFGNDFAGLIVVQIWSSITLAANDEFVQVGVGPSHCDLQYAMKLLESGLASEFNAPPDRRICTD